MLRSRLMPTDQILSMLIAERDKLNRAIDVLRGTPRPATERSTTVSANNTRKRKGKRWTAAMREAARERSKTMWAKRRKAAKKG